MTNPLRYARYGKAFIFSLLLITLLAACDLSPTPATPTPLATPTAPALPTAMPRTTPAPGPLLINVDKGVATKEMDVQTSRGLITIDLYPNAAPNTVAVYENMANTGQYDGHTFHRVENWVLQGNDPKGDGSGGGDIPTELNKIPYGVGSVGIARTNDIRFSNDSQFFITKATDPNGGRDFSFLNTTLDASGTPTGGYTLIGQLTSSMNMVQAMQVGDKIISIRIHDKSGAAQTSPNQAQTTPLATTTTVVSATVTPASTPTGNQVALAQTLIDAASYMKGLSSFHIEEISQSSTVSYTLSGDVSTSGSSTIAYNQAGQIFNLITIGSQQYYSADGGKTWQPSTTDLLANVKYYFIDIWTYVSSVSASKFAASIKDLGNEAIAGQATHHFSVNVEALYGNNSGAMGAFEFWIAPDKTVRRMATSGTSSSGLKVNIKFDWSNFNVPVIVTTPTVLTTPTPQASAGVTATTALTFTNYDNVNSYHFSYTNVITSDKSITTTISDVGDIVRPNKARVVNQNSISTGSSSVQYIIIGDDQYSRSSTVGWSRASGGTARYQQYIQLLTNQTSGLGALLGDMTVVGDEDIGGELCTHYRYIVGASLGFYVDLWVAKSDQRPRQIHSVTTTNDVLITISNVNKAVDITAP